MSRRTHCLRGHELTDDNLVLRDGRPSRECKTCSQQRARDRARQHPAHADCGCKEWARAGNGRTRSYRLTAKAIAVLEERQPVTLASLGFNDEQLAALRAGGMGVLSGVRL